MSYPIVRLKQGKEVPLLRHHPWVFSGAVKDVEGKPEEGSLVEVQAANGRVLGIGHYQEASIRVRILAEASIQIDQAFWNQRMTACFQRRRTILLPGGGTNIYRLVHGEGDFLPGLIVDVYGSTAVVQCHTAGMHRSREQISSAILFASGGQIRRIFDKSFETPAGLPTHVYLAGQYEEEVCTENGLSFKVDYEQGQKTGFFIDQRENRELLRKYAAGKSVLNTFCYSGGFSVYALAGGASQVVSVDSSASALDMTIQNVGLNQAGSANHEAIRADVPEWLKGVNQQFDLVVVDPPAFAKHTEARHRAVQAYKRLNANAIKQVRPGGMMFSFSCSQVVDRELFRHTLTAAAIESGRKVQVLHQLSQGPDHPVNAFHPEGEYLKGLVLLVEE